MTAIPITIIPRPVHRLQTHRQRADALRLIRLDRLRRALFEAYVDEAIGNPETPGAAVWGGPAHNAWHSAFRAYAEAYGAFQQAYGMNPPATLYGVFGGTR